MSLMTFAGVPHRVVVLSDGSPGLEVINSRTLERRFATVTPDDMAQYPELIDDAREYIGALETLVGQFADGQYNQPLLKKARVLLEREAG